MRSNLEYPNDLIRIADTRYRLNKLELRDFNSMVRNPRLVSEESLSVSEKM